MNDILLKNRKYPGSTFKFVHFRDTDCSILAFDIVSGELIIEYYSNFTAVISSVKVKDMG